MLISTSSSHEQSVESETNDTIETANDATLGTPIAGQLATNADLDVFKFVISASGTVTLNFDSPIDNRFSEFFQLGWYDSAGNLLSLFETGEDQTYTVGAAAAGTYYAAVSATQYYYDSGQYSLTVSHMAGSADAFESETNDTIETANDATLGTPIAGQLATNADLDVFKFVISASGTVTLNFDSPIDNRFSEFFQLGWYDSAGNLLSLFETGEDQTYTVGAAAAGTYYAAVSATQYYYDSGQYSLTVSHMAGSADAFESETNDTIETANDATLGTPIAGQLATNADLDVFKFVISASGTVTLNFDSPIDNRFSEFFQLGWYDSAGNLLSLFETGEDQTYTVGAAAAGTYYAAVSATQYYYDSGQYSLTVSHMAGSADAFESETNDTIETANDATLGTPIAGQLATNADLDVFKFVISASGTVTLNFDSPIDNRFSEFFQLGWYDSAGNLLSLFETGEDQTYTVGAAAAGTYYAAVSATQYYYDSGQYSLTVSHMAGSADAFESETNDTIETANDATLGTPIAGQLATNADLDVFKFVISASGTVTLNFDSPIDNRFSEFFQLGWYDSAGNLLSLFETGEDQTYTVGAAAAGTYYAAVSATQYYYDSGQYSLTVSHMAGSADAFESETNDTIETANDATLGTPIAGQLATNADLDVFKFVISASGTVTLNFDSPIDNRFSEFFQLGWYDSAGNLLSLFETGEDQTYTVGAAAAGTYYAAVSATQYYYDSGQYSLTVSHMAGSADAFESETNDTIETANDATLGTPIAGQLATNADLDVFKFVISASGTVTLNFDSPIDNRFSEFFQLGWYDSAGNLLSLFETGEDQTYTVGAAAAGTYYAAVSATQYYYDSGQYSLTVSHMAGSADAFESETNDTIETANDATLGTPIAGQLATNADLDVFKFVISASGTVTLNFDSPIDNRFSEFFQLGWYDSAGNLLSLFETGEDQTYTVGAAAAGTYYAAVSATQYYYDSGQYSLTVSHMAGSADAFESETNDTIETANDATLGTPIAGQLATNADLDVFKFVISASGTVTLNFDSPIDNRFSEFFQLGWYDSAGNLLSLFETGEDQTYTVGAAAAGTYYAAVSATQYYYDSGQYSLTVSHMAGSADAFESETNDTIETANDATLGTPIAGQLATNADLDVFKFVISASGTVTLNFDSPIDNRFSEFFQLGWYDSAGNLLSLFETGEDQTYTVGAAAAGTYYAAVSATQYYYDSGQYSLTVSHMAGSADAFESETNDTIETANDATLGTPIAGQLATNADLDFFKFTTEESGVLNVVFDSSIENQYSEYFNISVFNSDEDLLANQSVGRDVTFQVGLDVAGTYFVSVISDAWFYNSDQYSLTLSTSAGGNIEFEQEPNDEYANILKPGSAKRGQLSVPTDIDLYYLETDQPGNLNISFDSPTDNVFSEYFRLTVFEENGNLVASRVTGQDLNFLANAEQAGGYFVAVMAGDFQHDTGEYALTVTPVSSTVDRESEPNNTSVQADLLELGSPVLGQLSSEQDEDRYVISLTSPGTLTLSFDSPTDSNWADYFQIDLYSSDQVLIATRSIGSDAFFDTYLDSSGTYYVSIKSPRSFFDDGEYRLLANAILDDPIPEGALVGTPLDDQLSGTDQDEFLYGLGGNDQLNGGRGIDTAVFRAQSSNLTISTIEGLTTVRGDYAAGEHAYSTSRLWNIEKIQTWSDTEEIVTISISPILGTPGSDVISGTDKDDLLDGLGGADFVDAGAGNDTLVIFGAKDQFETLTIAGITQIVGGETSSEYANQQIKAANLEFVAFNQGQRIQLESHSSNKVFGTVASDYLSGTPANDVIDGQGGNDNVDGQAGEDTLVFFARTEDFLITYPSKSDPRVIIQGKANTPYSGQTTWASNVEFLAFTDRTLIVQNAPQIILSPKSTLVAEGVGGASLEVALSIAPSTGVTIKFDGGDELVSSVPALRFDPTNWNETQSLTISAIDDSSHEQQHSGLLSISTATTDGLYRAIADQTIEYTISDNDSATSGSVSGVIWSDFNNNGVIDQNEQGLRNWVVFDDANSNGKLDNNETHTQSDISGAFRLDDLSPGSHTISATVQSGWIPTYPNASNSTATIITSTAPTDDAFVGSVSIRSTSADHDYSNLGSATNISAFHSDPRFSSIDGKGYAVVVIDTGIDLDHPFFGADINRDGVADRIVFQYDFVGFNDADASDGNGHGTHVAGIVGSSDTNFPGVAPGVNIIALKVLSDDGFGSGWDITEAVNWVVRNADRYNIVAVNLSLGDGSFHKNSYSGYLASQFKTLANRDIIVVSASGNEYSGTQGVSYPSADPNSLSVGAVWAADGSFREYQGSVDAIAFFSQRDDTETDIFAPGVLIDSAEANGSHIQLSGTSMASPEVAGMVALAQQLAERELGRRLSLQEIRDLISNTGATINDGDDESDIVPSTGLDFHRIDMLALAEAILQLRPFVSQSVFVTAGETTPATDFGFTTSEVTVASAADDLIFGTNYGETLRGGGGADQISGLDGDDIISGDSGDDSIRGGEGSDALSGGPGSDTFEYSTRNDSTLEAYDIIADLSEGDSIQFIGIAGITQHSDITDFDSTIANTVSNIIADVQFNNIAAFFTDGTDGYIYVKGSGSGESFDGTLIAIEGQTVAPLLDGIEVASPSEVGNTNLVGATYTSVFGGSSRTSNISDIFTYYGKRLQQQPEEGFDSSIQHFLAEVSVDEKSIEQVKNAIDYAFQYDEVTLTGIVEDQNLWELFF